MTQEGFLPDLRGMELFFRICRRYKIEGHEPRLALIRLLAKRKKATYLRDVSRFTEGKTVLKIMTKRHDDEKQAN